MIDLDGICRKAEATPDDPLGFSRNITNGTYDLFIRGPYPSATMLTDFSIDQHGAAYAEFFASARDDVLVLAEEIKRLRSTLEKAKRDATMQLRWIQKRQWHSDAAVSLLELTIEDIDAALAEAKGEQP